MIMLMSYINFVNCSLQPIVQPYAVNVHEHGLHGLQIPAYEYARSTACTRTIYFKQQGMRLLRFAHFVALDTFGHIGTCVRSLLYLVMYCAFAQPRAALW
jgi:hypothetical protein